MRLRTTIVFCLSILAFTTLSLWGQETRGAITGKVTDPQNAVIPAVSVAISNAETGVKVSTTTNETGYFEVNLLNAGTYTITAETAGFKQFVRSGIALQVADRLNIDIQMQVGQAVERVEV